MNILHLVHRPRPLSSKMVSLLNEENAPTPVYQNRTGFSKVELKHKLSEIEYKITQEKFTERPFSGKYVREFSPGIYHCVVCDAPLFDNASKFYSDSGWPSFSNVLKRQDVYLQVDTSSGMERVEVKCCRCGAHLGHVFDDGPKPTGLRYCINSGALKLSREQPLCGGGHGSSK
ncbi:Peptide methionine sulfoxide reductase B3 [Clonorchis sinensis]|uniref:Peptide-methionine (R)-S-oxide reductase n=1 Tax=Clonorchis sinensis TaxID=79923 RepID=A0A8T1MIZ2_CLOSI|nr:Peptide methionine sulfoxide reductase B3 [Clonorchis sinensis]